MIRLVKLLVLPLGLLLLSGCASLEWAAPEVNGRVIDARTRVPLPHVAITRYNGSQSEPVGETDEDGRFHIAPKKKIYVSSPLSTGDSARGSHLEFALQGYAHAFYDCSTYAGEAQSSEHPIFDSVVIELKPEGAGDKSGP